MIYYHVPAAAIYVVTAERCWCCDLARAVTDAGLCTQCRDDLAGTPTEPTQ